MIRFFAIVYYRLMRQNSYEKDVSIQKAYTFIQILALLTFNIISILGWIDALLGTKYITLNGWLAGTSPLNKLIKIPLLLAPIGIALFYIIKRNEKRINEIKEELDRLPPAENKTKMRMFWWYIALSIFLFISGLMFMIIKK